MATLCCISVLDAQQLHDMVPVTKTLLKWLADAMISASQSQSPTTSDSGMQPLPLNVRVDRVGQHVVRARLFLDLWFYFEEVGSRSKIIDTMRDYNEFFRFTPHAYFTSFVIYIAGVFDKTKGTISLHSLVREIQATGRLVGHEAAAVTDLMAKASPLADKVATLRHNAFAHRSAHISYNDVFVAANVLPAQLRELTDLSLEIANHLLAIHDLQPQFFTKAPREAAEAMMKALEPKT